MKPQAREDSALDDSVGIRKERAVLTILQNEPVDTVLLKDDVLEDASFAIELFLAAQVEPDAEIGCYFHREFGWSVHSTLAVDRGQAIVPANQNVCFNTLRAEQLGGHVRQWFDAPRRYEEEAGNPPNDDRARQPVKLIDERLNENPCRR